MRTRLHQTWQSRTPRERITVTILAVILGVALYVWLLQSGSQARARLQANVATLRAEAAGLELRALELERLRATPVTPASRGELGEQVQVQVDAAGLAHAVASFDAPDADRVVASFSAVGFAELLNWVSSLNSQHVRLAACRIDALPEPGMVAASVTMQRDK